MIQVFKTSVKTEVQVEELKPYLDKLFSFSKWSFDLEDTDKVFRIESAESTPVLIKFLFKVFDFNCEEL